MSLYYSINLLLIFSLLKLFKKLLIKYIEAISIESNTNSVLKDDIQYSYKFIIDHIRKDFEYKRYSAIFSDIK